MAHVQFTDVQSRPLEFLDLTSLTLDEFQQLVPPFEAAFHAHLAAWRLDGKPRTARQFTVYKNCPLPTPEDRLFFILTYRKTYALQVVQGRLFGMGQSKANQWIHVLLPVLLTALRTLGDAPARSLTALAQRLGVAEADAATVVVPLEEEPTPVAPIPAAAPASPLLPMTAPSDASSAPRTLRNGKKRDHTVKNVLLVNALLLILFLSDTHGGRVHDLRIAEATPYPLPAGSGLLQGRCRKGVDPVSYGSSKFIAIDEQPNDQIVHALRLGKTDGTAHQPFDPGPQIDVFALDFLRVLLSHPMLCGVDVPLVRPPPI